MRRQGFLNAARYRRPVRVQPVIHLHEEQFDDWLHAACHKMDLPRGDRRIVGEDVFATLHRHDRCSFCSRIHWPRGGDPE